MAHVDIGEVERDNCNEILDAISRRMFAIEIMSSMARAELGCTWMTDKQKVKYIVEEIDIIETAIDMIKNMYKDIV